MLRLQKKKPQYIVVFVAFVSGFEPLAFRLGGGPSILLRYTNKNRILVTFSKVTFLEEIYQFYSNFYSKNVFVCYSTQYIVFIFASCHYMLRYIMDRCSP